MLPNLNEKLTELQPILYASERLKKIFPEKPIVAYRRNRNLNDLLVSRRLPMTLETAPQLIRHVDKNSPTCEICERSFKNGTAKSIHYTRMHEKKNIIPVTGFSKCGDPRCMTCKKGVFVNELLITETKETYRITQPITCKTSNLVYCITCLKCKDQYIGETGQELHRRNWYIICRSL